MSSDQRRGAKKGFCLLLCTVFTATAAATSAAAADSGYIRGDADGNRVVTVNDVTAVQKRLAELPQKPFDEKAADVDGNGLTINDATSIQYYLAEFGNPYGIGKWVGDHTEPPTDEYEF